MTTVHPDHRLSMVALEAEIADPPEEHLRRYLRFRGTQPGEWIALEVIGVPDNPRFRSRTGLALTQVEAGAAQLTKQSDDSLLPKGCFVQQNALASHVPARHPSDRWIPLKPGEGVKAEDIATRRAFYVDFDPVRPRDVSATDAERAGAFERASEFVDLAFAVLGDDRALGLGSSGNGVQVHVALDDLPNNARVEQVIKRFLAATAAIFDNDALKVDQSVTDARRICPAFGSMKRKGSNFGGDGVPPEQARPHRRTAFICHEQVRRLTLANLEAACAEFEARAPSGGSLAAAVVKASDKPSSATTTSTKSPWDLAKEVDIERVSEWLGLGAGAEMECPACRSTQGYGRVPDSNVVKCHHDRCSTTGVPGKPGTRTTIDLVVEAMSVSPKQAVDLLAEEFGFASLAGAHGDEKQPPLPPPASTGADWEDGLLRDDRGRIRAATANLELIMMNDSAWSGMLGFNELRNGVVFLAPPPEGFLHRAVGDEWQDDDDVAACNWFQRRWGVFTTHLNLRAVVSLVAHRWSFHPIRAELGSFAWDGTERVQTWLSKYLGATDNEYARTVGRWFLISAVARVMHPGCKVDTMLILEGPQGLRKSSAVQALAGEDYFLEDLREVGGVESAKQLRGKWIVELSELDAMRKAESSTIKRFVSQRIDNYRPSYGRSTIDFPRQCVFIGSTNHQDYLQDETGGRRFWPVKCGDFIDLGALKRDRDQIWAEAVELHRAGERWWPETDAEIALCGVEQDERQAEDPWTGRVAAFVAEGGSVTVAEILNEALGVEVSRMDRTAYRRVGAILRNLGWVRKKQEDKRETDAEGAARARRRQRRVFVRGPDAEPARDKPARVPTDKDPASVLRLVAQACAPAASDAPDGEATTPSPQWDNEDAVRNLGDYRALLE